MFPSNFTFRFHSAISRWFSHVILHKRKTYTSYSSVARNAGRLYELLVLAMNTKERVKYRLAVRAKPSNKRFITQRLESISIFPCCKPSWAIQPVVGSHEMRLQIPRKSLNCCNFCYQFRMPILTHLWLILKKKSYRQKDGQSVLVGKQWKPSHGHFDFGQNMELSQARQTGCSFTGLSEKLVRHTFARTDQLLQPAIC